MKAVVTQRSDVSLPDPVPGQVISNRFRLVEKIDDPLTDVPELNPYRLAGALKSREL